MFRIMWISDYFKINSPSNCTGNTGLLYWLRWQSGIKGSGYLRAAGSDDITLLRGSVFLNHSATWSQKQTTTTSSWSFHVCVNKVELKAHSGVFPDSFRYRDRINGPQIAAIDQSERSVQESCVITKRMYNKYPN